MFKAILDMVGSKKAIAAVAGLIVSFALKYGLELDTESVAAVISPILAYILGQGFADQGKHA